MIYLTLYFEFFRIALFSVGGGLATIPYLQELTERYDWITGEELLNIIAIAESTPGPIGVNAATYVGYNASGILGGIIAVLGIVTPSVIIIVVIAHFFSKMQHNDKVQHAFYGIRPVVAGLIGAAGFEVAKIALLTEGAINWLACVVVVMLFVLISKWKKHPIVYILIGALVGMILRM